MTKGLRRSLRSSQFNNNGDFVKVTLPVRNLPLTVTTVGAGVGFGSAILAPFPQGNVLLFGAVSYLSFSTVSANVTSAVFTSVYGVGTTVDAAGTLAGTEMDIVTQVTNG